MSDNDKLRLPKRVNTRNMTFEAAGITNEAYLEQMRRQEARHNRDPILLLVEELLDKFVKAYDERQRYGGSRIAEDATVDHAYNGMLRREEERAQAFINRCKNPPAAAKPGLELPASRGLCRAWLSRVAEAGERREQVRREVLREIRTLARESE